jgi:hypothetical protein
MFQDDEDTVIYKKRKRWMTEDDFQNGSGSVKPNSNIRICMNGENCFKEKCTFFHKSGMDRRGLQQGSRVRCRYGNKCKKKKCPFRHSRGERSSLLANNRGTMCRFFSDFGWCKRGGDCYFTHDGRTPKEGDKTRPKLETCDQDSLGAVMCNQHVDRFASNTKKKIKKMENRPISMKTSSVEVSLSTSLSSSTSTPVSDKQEYLKIKIQPTQSHKVKDQKATIISKLKQIIMTENIKKDLKIYWSQHFSKSKQAYYYFNRKTKEKYWCEDNFPDGVAYEIIQTNNGIKQRTYFNVYTKKYYHLTDLLGDEQNVARSNSNGQDCKMVYFNPHYLKRDAQKLKNDGIFDNLDRLFNEKTSDISKPNAIFKRFLSQCNELFEPLATLVELNDGKYTISFALFYHGGGNVVLEGQANIEKNKIIETKTFYKSMLLRFVSLYIMLVLQQLNTSGKIDSVGISDNSTNIVLNKLRKICKTRIANCVVDHTKMWSDKDLYELLHKICDHAHESANPSSSLNNFYLRLKDSLFQKPEYVESIDGLTCTLRDIEGRIVCSYTAQGDVDSKRLKHNASSGVLLRLNQIFAEGMAREEQDRARQQQEHIARMSNKYQGNMRRKDGNNKKKHVSFLNDEGGKKPKATRTMYILDGLYYLYSQRNRDESEEKLL